MNDEQALVADFHPHFDFRCLQRDACRAALLAQAAADVALHVHRAEGVLAGALAAHCEYLPRQATGEVRLALLEDVIQIAQRILVHFEAMGDARRAAQAFNHLAQNLRVAERRLHLDVVPHPFHPQFGIEVAQHGADVLRQLTNEPLAHRRALDGDFRENLDDQLHENARASEAKKEGGGV